MASIQEALASLRQEIGSQQSRPLVVHDETLHDSLPQPPPPPVPTVPQASPYVLHGHSEVAPPVVVQTTVTNDAHAHMDRIEQHMRQMRVSDGSAFRMLDIERYTGIGCPRIHLRLYSTVMRAHELDESQMITLFPLSLSGAAQRWFAFLESSRCRTWDDLAQEIDESVSSFISRWCGKIAEIIDRPLERDKIQMVLRSLQPKIARHVVGVLFIDFGSLVLALYDVEDDILRGLELILPLVMLREETLWRTESETSRRHQPVPQLLETHPSYPLQQYRPRAPRPTHDQSYMPQTLALPYYATQGIERSPVSYKAIGQPCYCSALRKLTEARLLTALTPRPPPQPIPPQFRMDLHCAYHQGPGHETDRCTALRHVVQDLIDQGLVHLGQPSVTTNPLPAHTTHVVPPPADGIHFLDFVELDDHVHMLSWDDSDPSLLSTLGPWMPVSFGLVPRAALVQTAIVEPLIFPYYSVQTSFILIPDVEEPPPVAARSVEGTSAPEEVRIEDDEILRQLQSTQAPLSSIRVDTTTSPKRLIHMMTAGRATCIVFFDDDLPPEGSDHTRPLYISVDCSGRQVPSILLDNGLALNVCPLATAIALGYAPSDFGPSTQTIRAYDSTQRKVMAGAIPYSLHQKVKFIHDGQVIVVQSIGDVFISAEPVLQISHTDDDLFLTGFTFDEVQTLEIEDFCRDFVAMSFDQHNSTVVLDMMRGMSYLPGMGLGRPTSLVSSWPSLITT
ncbi:hypothetical protein AAG906_019442 [Vitis piasezkii]